MRVLAHIHTMNDVAVIEQALEGLRRQTRPPDAILIVDNASTDGTLDRIFSETATIIRNSENLGTSGAVRIGFAYALEHGFDWTWVFDADSVPEAGALEALLAFFERLASAEREQVCFLAGWPLTPAGEVKEQPIRLQKAALELISLESVREFTQCDCMIWSGTLYRMAAVARIGLPSADYVLDVAEIEYGYRARELGLTSYVVHNSVIRHDVGRNAGATHRVLRLGPVRLALFEISPARTYYNIRNNIYFWLYQHKPRRMSVTLLAIIRAFVFTFGFAVRPVTHWPQVVACIRGIRDGLTMHMERRY
ncbi:MAG: glycosyltransferase [Candidatus Acidiferrales bacterium]